MLMSFVGCISTLMKGTGLEGLLGCVFAPVQSCCVMNVMNGHIGGSNVNVQDTAELGTDMLRSF